MHTQTKLNKTIPNLVSSRGLIILKLISTILFISLVSSCDQNTSSNALSQQKYNGYIEGEFTYISAPIAGKLINIPNPKGSKINAGGLLFNLDEAPEIYLLKQVRALVLEAEANLHNIQKGLRPSEVESLRHELEAAQASVKYYRKYLSRNKKLFAQKHIHEDEIDKAIYNLESSKSLVEKYKQDIITAQLPARLNQINAAIAALNSSKAYLQQVQWKISQKQQNSPITGYIFDTYYNIGEYVPAQTPVMAILSPENTKAVFFIKEPKRGNIKLGQRINISCNNCPKHLKAEINYISNKAEYTPPIIYSDKTSAKLIYKVEASLPTHQAAKLHPGQPINVSL